MHCQIFYPTCHLYGTSKMWISGIGWNVTLVPIFKIDMSNTVNFPYICNKLNWRRRSLCRVFVYTCTGFSWKCLLWDLSHNNANYAASTMTKESATWKGGEIFLQVLNVTMSLYLGKIIKVLWQTAHGRVVQGSVVWLKVQVCRSPNFVVISNQFLRLKSSLQFYQCIDISVCTG